MCCAQRITAEASVQSSVCELGKPILPFQMINVPALMGSPRLLAPVSPPLDPEEDVDAAIREEGYL
ncbi:MAG: hypothetical protein RLZZ568_1100 [Cyanobacteriota bacterium]|jgi:hypothetical protein